MEKGRLYELLRNPAEIEEEDLRALQNLKVEQPYFALPNILIAKYFHDKRPQEAAPYVELASAYALNRKVFRDFLKGQQTVKVSIPKMEKSSHEASTFDWGAEMKKLEAEEYTAAKEEELADQAQNKENQRVLAEAKQEAEQAQKEKAQQKVETPASPEKKTSEPALQTTKTTTAIEQAQKLEQADKAQQEELEKNRQERLALIDKEREVFSLENFEMPEPSSIFKTKAKVKKAKEVKSEEKLISLKNYWQPPKMEEISQAKGVRKYTQNAVIEHFLRNRPSISRSERGIETTDERDLSANSAVLKEAPLTESFAQMLIRQGKKQEAQQVYQELKLRNPEKSGYFAEIILQLENQK